MESNEIERIMLDFFVEREGEGVVEIIRDIDLVDEGILDSLDVVTLGAYIEMKIGKKIDVTERGTLNSVRRFDSLLDLVS